MLNVLYSTGTVAFQLELLLCVRSLNREVRYTNFVPNFFSILNKSILKPISLDSFFIKKKLVSFKKTENNYRNKFDTENSVK